ncbi:MAG: tyrosine-type recombinase/integrase [Xanthobacteraceae bacterium]
MSLPVLISPERDVRDNDAIGHLPQALQDALRVALDLADQSHANATRRGYARDFADFTAWCSQVNLAPLPAAPATVAAYIAALVDRKLKSATISRRVAAIAYHHRHEADDPTKPATVRAILKGARNRLGTRPRKKAPLTAELVAKAVKKIPSDTLIGKRDKALLLLLFGAALRRSELVALDVADLDFRPQGVVVTIRRSKTDQSGKGQTIAVPTGSKLRVPDALKDWMRAAGISDGPVFRGVAKGGRVLPERLCDKQVARTVKKWAKAIKLDPDLFSGHSGRSGFATSAGAKDLVGTANHLRHAKLDTTRGYIQAEDAFKAHAGRSFL